MSKFSILDLCGSIKYLPYPEAMGFKSGFFPECTSSDARGCNGLQGLVVPNLTLLLGLFCAFGCQLFDASFPFAIIVLAVSNCLSEVTDGVGWSLQYGLDRCED